MTAAVKSCPRNGLGFLADLGSVTPSDCRGLRNGRGGQGSHYNFLPSFMHGNMPYPSLKGMVFGDGGDLPVQCCCKGKAEVLL